MRTERFEVWDHFRQLAQPGPLKHAAIPQRRRPRVARDVKVREARPGHARQPPRPSEGRSGESEDSEAGPAAGGEEVVHARLRSSRYTRDTFEIEMHARCVREGRRSDRGDHPLAHLSARGEVGGRAVMRTALVRQCTRRAARPRASDGVDPSQVERAELLARGEWGEVERERSRARTLLPSGAVPRGTRTQRSSVFRGGA